jgi:hypothetical protein
MDISRDGTGGITSTRREEVWRAPNDNIGDEYDAPPHQRHVEIAFNSIISAIYG